MPRTKGDLGLTLERLLRTITFVPVGRPRAVSAGRLTELLAEEGFSVSKRTVERDLAKVESIAGVMRDDSTKPHGWYRDARGVAAELVPALGLESAAMLELVRQHLVHTLPRETFDALSVEFERAKKTLSRTPEAKHARWTKKLRVRPLGHVLSPPKIDPGVHRAIYDALLHDRKCAIAYAPPERAARTFEEVHPLGLVLRDQTLVLVAMLADSDKVRQFHLHRMKKVDVQPGPARKPPRGFDLDRYLDEGRLEFQLGNEPLHLKLLAKHGAALYPNERPVGAEQTLSSHPEGTVISAFVPDTKEMRVWLRGYGASVEVLEPQSLRAELAGEAATLAALYR